MSAYKTKDANKKSMKRALRKFRREVAAAEGIISRETSEALFKVRKLGRPAKGYEKNDGFYESRAWKELRYEVIRDSDGKCSCCGADRSTGAVMHVDHIKPRYKFPELSLTKSNLQVLCADCNVGKGAWDQTDFGKKRVFKTGK